MPAGTGRVLPNQIMLRTNQSAALYAGSAVAFLLAAMGAQGAAAQPPVEDGATEDVVEVVAEKALIGPQAPELPPAPETFSLPIEHHAWARFGIGAWRTLRTVTETFDENGKFLTRSETLATEKLVDVDSDLFTLESTSIVEIGGKRLRGATQRSSLSLMSSHTSQPLLSHKLPSVDISLSGRSIPCQQWELTYGEGPQQRLETVYYSPEFPPYVLRREVIAPDSSGAADITGETISVLAVDVPILHDGGMISGYRRQVRTTAGPNQIERMELLSSQAPGGLVQASSTERDASGRRVRWIVTELEEFGDADDTPSTDRRWRLFQRRGR